MSDFDFFSVGYSVVCVFFWGGLYAFSFSSNILFKN